MKITGVLYITHSNAYLRFMVCDTSHS